MQYFVTVTGHDEVAVEVVQRPAGAREVRVDGEFVALSSVEVEGALNVIVDGHVVDLWAAEEDGVVHYSTGLERGLAQVESARERLAAAVSRKGGGGGGKVSAPMPGRVVKLMVAEGDVVAAGTPVVVVEAMKMENELCCERPGVVTAIHVSSGQNVEGGALLVELGPLDAVPDDVSAVAEAPV